MRSLFRPGAPGRFFCALAFALAGLLPMAQAAVQDTSVARNGAAERPVKILFVGNSFTYGGFDPAAHYNAENVTDLNGEGYGGVPGIFKQLTVQAGLSYDVSLETVGGEGLQYHYQKKLPQIGSRRWDVVVLQEYSVLDPDDPGNPAKLLTYSALLEQYVHGGDNANANPKAKVWLLQTWARADQLYRTPGGHWDGQTVEQMTADLHSAYALAAANDPAIKGVLPVGDAYARAVTSGIADRNPFDGITDGMVNVWDDDGYHASAWGSYLEALVVFGRLTRLDPRTLGSGCQAASDLGISPADAVRAQKTAYRQLKAR